tara:strand:- start:2096 stop:2785 length:690 start_codon:yes stop_codon:yes gene_type:complete
MNPEHHPTVIYYLGIFLFVILIRSYPAEVNSANHNNLAISTSFDLDSTVSESSTVRTPRTFRAFYKLQPISKVIYDLSTFFDLNSLILDLENRIISHEFLNCNLQQCLEELHGTGRIRMQYGTNFAVFSRSESSIPNIKAKFKKMSRKLLNADQTTLNMSVYNGSIFLVLSRLIKEGKLALKLSNQLESKISLHLKSTAPFEVLLYVTQHYKLRIINNDGVRSILPTYK